MKMENEDSRISMTQREVVSLPTINTWSSMAIEPLIHVNVASITAKRIGQPLPRGA